MGSIFQTIKNLWHGLTSSHPNATSSSTTSKNNEKITWSSSKTNGGSVINNNNGFCGLGQSRKRKFSYPEVSSFEAEMEGQEQAKYRRLLDNGRLSGSKTNGGSYFKTPSAPLSSAIKPSSRYQTKIIPSQPSITSIAANKNSVRWIENPGSAYHHFQPQPLCLARDNVPNLQAIATSWDSSLFPTTKNSTKFRHSSNFSSPSTHSSPSSSHSNFDQNSSYKNSSKFENSYNSEHNLAPDSISPRPTSSSFRFFKTKNRTLSINPFGGGSLFAPLGRNEGSNEKKETKLFSPGIQRVALGEDHGLKIRERRKTTVPEVVTVGDSEPEDEITELKQQQELSKIDKTLPNSSYFRIKDRKSLPSSYFPIHSTPLPTSDGVFGSRVRSGKSSKKSDQSEEESSYNSFYKRRESDDVIEILNENENEKKSEEGDDDEDDDDDIKITYEKVINTKHDPFKTNSFELETRTSIYRQKSWLQNSKEMHEESRRAREAAIEIENRKLAVLKSHSTLPGELESRIRQSLTITDIIELEPQEIQLPPLTAEMRKLIESSVRGRENDGVVTAFNIIVTRGDLKTLAPCQWLNDNVINFYMELIGERAKNGKYPSAHIFSTFFYPKYLKEGYSNMLKRWTRKVDIFSMDMIIFPIHLGIHWCLAVADLRNKTIKFYDSLLGRNERCLDALFSYLNSEHKERKKSELKKGEWSCTQEYKIPVQENGSDCGVFACKFAEYLSRDAGLTFKQKDMNYYRDRMVYEIVTKTLIYP